MTRVWSLGESGDEESPSESLLTFYNYLKLHRTDSGYDSSPFNNSISSGEYQDLRQFQNNRSGAEQRQEFSSSSGISANGRVSSSPIAIPMPRDRKYKRTLRYHHQSSLSSTTMFSPCFDRSSQTESLLSSFSQSSASSLERVGHPPCVCGCIRGYRNQYLYANLFNYNDNLMSRIISSTNYIRESQTESDRSVYPLPDIVSSSQLSRTSIGEITMEIGADLRRISKDFITTRYQKIQTNKFNVISGLIGIVLSFFKQLIQSS